MAVPVRDLPKGILTLARAFTGEPLASRLGPRFRWRSFSQAIITAGPEMTPMMPRIAKGICHQASLRKPVIMLAIAVPRAPRARPMATQMPADLAASKGVGGAAGAAGYPASAFSAVATICVSTFPMAAFSLAAAIF